MGVEHLIKSEDVNSCRCPGCEHISTVKVGSDDAYVSLFAGPTGPYFVCQNPNCNVERIYSDNAVMVSGR